MKISKSDWSSPVTLKQRKANDLSPSIVDCSLQSSLQFTGIIYARITKFVLHQLSATPPHGGNQLSATPPHGGNVTSIEGSGRRTIWNIIIYIILSPWHLRRCHTTWEEYSWCVGIASLVRQAFVVQALVSRSSHKEEGAECQKLRHHSFYLRSIYLNTSECREARTRLEPSKEAKVKIEGYVTLFHTKYFNHAISIILPFCFEK